MRYKDHLFLLLSSDPIIINTFKSAILAFVSDESHGLTQRRSEMADNNDIQRGFQFVLLHSA